MTLMRHVERRRHRRITLSSRRGAIEYSARLVGSAEQRIESAQAGSVCAGTEPQGSAACITFAACRLDNGHEATDNRRRDTKRKTGQKPNAVGMETEVPLGGVSGNSQSW
eukprot:Amastigsp_a7720_59.p3 type:complete len:110 gc:universal Amastigsp_a7720_59:164-493(+)